MKLMWKHDGASHWDLKNQRTVIAFVHEKPPYRAHWGEAAGEKRLDRITHAAQNLKEAKAIVKAIVLLEG